MFRVLSLVNWCNHEEYTLEFDPACTILVGANGSGKSAIFRALEWVCFNQWGARADSFITHGKAFAHVKLWTDKHCIERLKGKVDRQSTNIYRLDGEDLRFDSVNRRSVPESISQALCLTSDNFQRQQARSFWLGLPAPEVARCLNRIVNLDAIDISLGNIATEVRRARSEEEVCKQRLESCEERIAQFGWVEQAHAALCTVEQLEGQIKQETLRIAQVERSLAEATQIARVRDNASALILVAQEAITKAEAVSIAEQAYRSLYEQVVQAQECARIAQETRKQLKATQAKLNRELSLGCPLCGAGRRS